MTNSSVKTHLTLFKRFVFSISVISYFWKGNWGDISDLSSFVFVYIINVFIIFLAILILKLKDRSMFKSALVINSC